MTAAEGSLMFSGNSSNFARATAIISRVYRPATTTEIVRTRASIGISRSPRTVVCVQPRHLLRGRRVTPISPQMGVNNSTLPYPATLPTVRTLPGTPRIQSSLGPTTPLAETQFIDGVLQLAYIAEFLLLLNYIEFIIPVIYATYLAAVYHLQNRIYFLHIDSMTAEHLNSTLASLYLYAGLELVSLLLLHIVLSRVFHLPGLAQLAYTLETQRIGVQSKLIFWVLYNAQASLKHNGKAFRLQLEVCVAPRAAYRFQSHRFVSSSFITNIPHTYATDHLFCVRLVCC